MATKVPVRVARSSSIYTDVSVDQSQTLGASDCFSLGEYILDSVTTGYVQIANTGTTGYVFADAVKFQRLTSSTDRSVVLQQALETYTYDADGNLSGDGLWTYTWDGENRLIKMESLMSVPAAYRKKITFAYDYMGRRVRKSAISWDVDSGEYATWSATTLKFVYDGWNLVAVFNNTNVCQRTYSWGTDLSGSFQGAGGIGGMLMTREHQSSPAVYFSTYDGNGNLTGLVKAADGVTGAKFLYNPYGKTLNSTGPYLAKAKFGFSTKYQPPSLGLIYFGYRYYNPETGRWLNRDPIEEKGGINLYCFVNSEPIRFRDPLGLYIDPECMRKCQGRCSIAFLACMAVPPIAPGCFAGYAACLAGCPLACSQPDPPPPGPGDICVSLNCNTVSKDATGMCPCSYGCSGGRAITLPVSPKNIPMYEVDKCGNRNPIPIGFIPVCKCPPIISY